MLIRANPHLQELIEDLDIHLAKYSGDEVEARDRLTKADNDWIDSELLHCITDARYFISNYYAYRDEKEGFKGLYPLFDSQEILYDEYRKLEKDHGRVRALVLKARQMGSTTYNAAEFFHKTIFSEHINAMIVAQDEDMSQYIMGMYESALDFIPWWMRPRLKARETGSKINFDERDDALRMSKPGLKTWIYADNARKPTGVGRGKSLNRALLCLSESNLLLLKNGLTKSISDAQTGDEVLIENGFSRVVGIAKREASSVYPGAELGYRITPACNRALPIDGTGNHTLLTCERYRYSDTTRYRNEAMRELHEITTDHALVIPVVPITEDGSYPSSQSFGGSPQGGGVVSFWTPPAPSREFGFAIGLYLAEGSFLNNKIAISVDRDEEYLADRFAKAVGQYWKKYPAKTSRTCVYCFHNRSMADWFRKFIGMKDSKILPWEMWKMGREMLTGVVEGLILGDGHFLKTGDQTSFASTRAQLAIGLREAVMSLGYGYGGICSKEAGYRSGRNCQKIWAVVFSGDTNREIRKMCGEEPSRITKRQGSHWSYSEDKKTMRVHVRATSRIKLGLVYDIEIASNRHLFRLPGALTHNSELSFWNNGSQLSKSLFPTMNTPDGFYVMESTANGRNNFWHNLWRRAEHGEIDWHPIFIPFYRREKTYSLPLMKGEVFTLTEEETNMRERIQREDKFLIKDETFNWMRKRKQEFIATDGDDSMFSQEYTSEPEESFQSSAVTAFPRAIIRKFTKITKDPILVGEISWDDKTAKPKPYLHKVEKDEEVAYPSNHSYRFHVWEEPIRGAKYSLGCDVSLGNEGSDFSCVQVLRLGEGQERDIQVACWHGLINPSALAGICCAIGTWYNHALAAVEVNSFGEATNFSLMRQYEYENIYRFKRLDRITNFITNISGWLSTSKSTDSLMAKMSEYFLEDNIVINCRYTMDEFNDYTEEGARGKGAHDDMVDALLIALFCGHEGEVKARQEGRKIHREDRDRYLIYDRFGTRVENPEGFESLSEAERLAKKYPGSSINKVSNQTAYMTLVGKRFKVPATTQNTEYSPIFDDETSTGHRLHFDEGIPTEDITPEMQREFEEEQEELENSSEAWKY